MISGRLLLAVSCAASILLLIQNLPGVKQGMTARFRKRNDAEDLSTLYKGLNPAIRYEIYSSHRLFPHS